jgi:iron complex outermembrane receptor protein
MHFARRSIAVATALALTTPLPGRAEESDAAVTESPSTATEKKSQRTDLPETELQELRVQAAPDSDRFRATEATTGALGERPLVDTPFSINVITDALIRNQQNDTPQDVFKNDPSFASGNVPVPFSTLRGFAIGDNGYLYDGLPAFVGLSGARGQLQGIDRIEVLKGPSAFLNGIGASTSLGGTLNFIPKRPLAVPVREISASYASETLFGVHADIGDRFGADRQFGYRTNLAYRDGEQAIDGARWRQTVATFAADWRATPDLLLNATFDYVDNQTPRFQSFFAVVPGIAVPAAPDARRNLSFSWNDFQQQDYRGTVRADWSLNNDWSITAQALLGHTWRPTVFAGGFGLITSETGDTLTLNSANTLDSDYGSGQVLLHGKFVTGPLSHQFTAGGSASGNDQNSAQGSIAALPSNLYFPLDYFNQTPALPASAPYQKQRSYGALLSDIIGFGDQWSVVARRTVCGPQRGQLQPRHRQGYGLERRLEDHAGGCADVQTDPGRPALCELRGGSRAWRCRPRRHGQRKPVALPGAHRADRNRCQVAAAQSAADGRSLRSDKAARICRTSHPAVRPGR